MRKGVCCSEDPLSSFSSRGQLFSRKSFLVRLWKFRESSSATGNTTGSTEAKRLSNEGKNASAQARELEKKLGKFKPKSISYSYVEACHGKKFQRQKRAKKIRIRKCLRRPATLRFR